MESDLQRIMRILGGVGSRKILERQTSRRQLDEGLQSGELVRITRGCYALPAVSDASRLAVRATGVVCLTNAALSWGWGVKTIPDKPHVAVPKDRRLSEELAQLIIPSWIDLAHDETEGYATTEAKTLEMCGRRLAFDEALAITDSALRAGYPREVLREAANIAKGPGSARFRRVASYADARADNPFESVLRAIALDVPGLSVEPQVRVRGELGLDVRPDLVDRRRRIVLEADSFEWHGDRAALRRDARRYDLLVVNDWLVLRFSWEDVMHDQEWVRAVLVAAAMLPH